MNSVFSAKEISLLSELRKLVGELLEDEFQRTDDFLIRWIRYANSDVKKAEQALRNNKKWRQENNWDRIMLEDMKDVQEVFPINMEPGFDKFGCPILVAPQNWEIKQFVNGSPDGKDRYVRYFLRNCEHAMNILRKQYIDTDGQVTRFSLIVNMDGFCYHQLVSTRVINALTETAKISEANFPGIAKSIYVINVPKTFKILFNIMKPFLSGDTISRIKLFDKTKWREALLEDIPEDQLLFLLPESENIS